MQTSSGSSTTDLKGRFLHRLRQHFLFEPDEELEISRDIPPAPPWDLWLKHNFPTVAYCVPAPRHKRLWEWFEAIRPGLRPRPRVECWGRGGAKSSTVELAVVYTGQHVHRRFVLYVSGTQEQADKHVGSISTYFERLGIERSVGKYGSSKGWRRDQLRTADGFNVAALGLDVGTRGIKLDEFRPDLIIFDDIDALHDTPQIIKKKIDLITSTVLPAGSTDCATLFIQNLIHEDSIMSQLVDGRADFLHTREVPPIEPAVRGLKIESRFDEDLQKNVWKIIAGEATWEGQDLQICEHQLNEWGKDAFEREAQHEVETADGVFFNEKAFNECEIAEVPSLKALCRAYDLGATEGGGDPTSSVLGGIAANLDTYILDATWAQISSEKVERLIIENTVSDRLTYHVPYTVRLPQDPGQAGKAQKVDLRKLLRGDDLAPSLLNHVAKQLCFKLNGEPDLENGLIAYKRLLGSVIVKIVTVTGPKPVRARTWQKKVNSANAYLVKSWHRLHSGYRQEHRKFREDMTHLMDDQVDASADMANELLGVQSFEFTLIAV